MKNKKKNTKPGILCVWFVFNTCFGLKNIVSNSKNQK